MTVRFSFLCEILLRPELKAVYQFASIKLKLQSDKRTDLNAIYNILISWFIALTKSVMAWHVCSDVDIVFENYIHKLQSMMAGLEK